MRTTAFTELIGCRAPVQQAPMGPVAGPVLAAAVAEAGGLGSLTVARRTADEVAAPSTISELALAARWRPTFSPKAWISMRLRPPRSAWM